MVKMQVQRGIGIFGCNYAAVISTAKVFLGNISNQAVYSWVNLLPSVGMGQRGVGGSTTDSFLNAYTFIKAWDTLVKSDQVWPYDFVVKVDPDAVFIPSRLRDHVREHVGKTIYFPNCGKWGGKVLLYGSIEVMSTQALRRYKDGSDMCNSLDWHGWGEDYYMQTCLDKLGVEAVPDLLQVADKRCLDAPCNDYTRAAFHDYKDPDKWFECFEIAVGDIKITTDLVPRK